MTSRNWLRPAAAVASLMLVLLAAHMTRAQDVTRSEDVTIHVLATAEGNGEIMECG